MFTADMIVGKILDIAPEKKEVLIKLGMYSMCPSATMETLEDACYIHKINLEDAIKMLNQ